MPALRKIGIIGDYPFLVNSVNVLGTRTQIVMVSPSATYARSILDRATEKPELFVVEHGKERIVEDQGIRYIVVQPHGYLVDDAMTVRRAEDVLGLLARDEAQKP